MKTKQKKQKQNTFFFLLLGFSVKTQNFYLFFIYILYFWIWNFVFGFAVPQTLCVVEFSWLFICPFYDAVWNRVERVTTEFDLVSCCVCRVSVNRRLQAGTISVIVWFGQTQALTKNIWHMAICQHQFYLDRRNSKARQLKARNLNDIALDLSKSSTSLSLSTASSNSQSNLSHSGSTLSLNGKMGQTPGTYYFIQWHFSLENQWRQRRHSLHFCLFSFFLSCRVEAEESEAARAARLEIVSALKSRKAAMEEKLKAKIEELKKLCLEEGALSGTLPPEYPLNPGEALPTIRRRVGTSFTLPENLLNKAKSSKV